MLEKAIEWLKNNHLNGQAVPITHRQRRPYPEVTGYYIPTLLSIGEIELAKKFAQFLVSVQNPNGSFSLDNPQINYVFDTGQVIRGWVSMLDRLPELAKPLENACNWIIKTSDPSTGRLLCPPSGGDWSLGPRGEINEGIHLYVLKPLRDAAEKLNRPDIKMAADRALNFYLNNVTLTNFTQANALTHFYAYIQEALFELGCYEEVKLGMKQVAQYQQNNGSIPAYHDVRWICSTGLAQIAKIWYLMNETARADAAMVFLSQLQNDSGGFYGSYGVYATYFPADEISWAVKYAIDAEQLRIAKHFDKTAHQYTDTISAQDGRAKIILNEIGNAKRILDAGCGKGRYAGLIKQYFPHAEIHAVDVSDEMLRHVSKDVLTQKASIQDLPYQDGIFDLIYCIEALEHVPNTKAAIDEMVRVLAPGGRLIIIDKNRDHLGSLQIESWERWFGVNELSSLLQQKKLRTHTEFVGYDGRAADGLFVAWIGINPGSGISKKNVNFYRSTFFDETNRQVVEACLRGDIEWIKNHLKHQDTIYSELFPDELFENRAGMQLIQQILARTGKKWDVIDVACGNAMLLRRLQRDGHQVQGVDASSVRANKNFDISIREGFCEKIPLQERIADVVIALECMEHVIDLDSSLRECMRILRPGGVFFCQVPFENFADGCNHVRLFTPQLLHSAIEGVGFEVIGLWQIPYLVGQQPNNLCVIAKKPGATGTADWVAKVLSTEKV